MIDYIKGTVAELGPTQIVLETGNIGYTALISLQTFTAFEGKTEGKLFIHHILREDEELDYGFATKEEREFFRLLIGVSGVGAATARMMLSSLTCEELRTAILSDDVNRIKSVKGIGLKSAQKVIIELKDKIVKGGGSVESDALFAQTSPAMEEAITALVLLGFNKSAAGKAVSAVIKKNPGATVEVLIKTALQML